MTALTLSSPDKLRPQGKGTPATTPYRHWDGCGAAAIQAEVGNCRRHDHAAPYLSLEGSDSHLLTNYDHKEVHLCNSSMMAVTLSSCDKL